MNLHGCATLPINAESAVWYRAIQPQHYNTALATSQSMKFPSRYNAGPLAQPPFEILYLAEDPLVAFFEVKALYGSPYQGYAPNPRNSLISLNVTVNLRRISEITHHAQQRSLDTTAQELTGDWYGYQQRRQNIGSIPWSTGLAPTQELGAAMYNLPALEGFRTLSARVPDRKILVVFPQKLLIGSSVEFLNPIMGKSDIISGTVPA